jgi:hypothetical protein
MITWDELVELEPRLLDLEKDVKSVKDDQSRESFCANDVWYGIFRSDLSSLVGRYSRGNDAKLRTPYAFEVAYNHLYELLPPCRNCLCW